MPGGRRLLGVWIVRWCFSSTRIRDSARQFSLAIAQARSRKKQKQLLVRLLAVIAQDQVPARPGRREPRAVKRRPEPYQLLNRPPAANAGTASSQPIPQKS